MTTLEMIDYLSSKTNEDGILNLEYKLNEIEGRKWKYWQIEWRPIRYPLEDSINYLYGCKNLDDGLSHMCDIAREKY